MFFTEINTCRKTKQGSQEDRQGSLTKLNKVLPRKQEWGYSIIFKICTKE